VPVALPAACGVKLTDTLAVFCGATVMGRVGPAKVKPVPETDACEMVRLNLVVLVMLTGLIKLLPTCTLPKLMLEVDAVWPVAVFEIKKRE